MVGFFSTDNPLQVGLIYPFTIIIGIGIQFHYVSSSPWPLASILYDWIKASGFPLGTMHLKKFRLELFEPWGIDLSVFNLLRNPTGYKGTIATTFFATIF